MGGGRERSVYLSKGNCAPPCTKDSVHGGAYKRIGNTTLGKKLAYFLCGPQNVQIYRNSEKITLPDFFIVDKFYIVRFPVTWLESNARVLLKCLHRFSKSFLPFWIVA